MRKAVKGILLGGLFMLGLLWGLRIALRYPPPLSPAQAATVTFQAGQSARLLLVLGDEERLMGVWMVLLSWQSADVDLLSIYPGMVGSNAMNDQLLAESYLLTENGEISALFWDMLSSRNYAWDMWVWLPPQGLQALAFQVQAFEDGSLPPPLVEGGSPSAHDIEAQAVWLGAICEGLRLHGAEIPLQEMKTVLQPYARASLRPEEEEALWRFIGAFSGQLRCFFPLLSPYPSDF